MNILARFLCSAFMTSVKGSVGQTLVQTGAALVLPSSLYPQYHDVTLPTASGTTQTDHVFMSVFGLFVVERSTSSRTHLGKTTGMCVRWKRR